MFLACVCAFVWQARAAETPPNIVLIVSSGHNYGVFGDQVTPHLFRLQEQGIPFSHAFCNAPVGLASRYSILTGKLPHSLGTTRLFTMLADDQVTLAHLLSLREELPYTCAAFGNLPFENMDRRRMEGKPLFGFRYWRTLDDVLEIYSKDPTNWHPRPIDENIKIQAPWRPFRDPPRVWLNSANLPIGAHVDAMPSTQFAGLAVDYMEKHKERPFFVFLTLGQPHAPFDFPVEFSNKVDPAKFKSPLLGPDDAAQIPYIYRDLTDGEKSGIIAASITATAYLDYCVGIVMQGIKRLGLEENTLVIYTSDTGYLLGQHGRFGTHSFDEPAIRIPLIFRWPARIKPGRTVDELVESIDILPTIAEAAGIQPGPRTEGRSLIGLLEGKEKLGRDAVFGEYLENEEAMIRTDKYKMIYSTGRRRRQDGLESGPPPAARNVRLYDVQKDGDEFHDLAANPAYAAEIKKMKQTMLDRFLISTPEGPGLPSSATVEDNLDLFLVPREAWRALWDWMRS